MFTIDDETINAHLRKMQAEQWEFPKVTRHGKRFQLQKYKTTKRPVVLGKTTLYDTILRAHFGQYQHIQTARIYRPKQSIHATCLVPRRIVTGHLSQTNPIAAAGILAETAAQVFAALYLASGICDVTKVAEVRALSVIAFPEKPVYPKVPLEIFLHRHDFSRSLPDLRNRTQHIGYGVAYQNDELVTAFWIRGMGIGFGGLPLREPRR